MFVSFKKNKLRYHMKEQTKGEMELSLYKSKYWLGSCCREI